MILSLKLVVFSSGDPFVFSHRRLFVRITLILKITMFTYVHTYLVRGLKQQSQTHVYLPCNIFNEKWYLIIVT